MSQSHAGDESGPPLRDYIETRLNLLTVAIEKQQIATDLRYQQRFDAAEKAVQAALSAADRAVSKAELASEKRFEGVNEFRQTLSDQSRNFLPRGEYSANHDSLRNQVNANSNRLSQLEGRIAGYAGAAALVGVVSSVVFNLIGH